MAGGGGWWPTEMAPSNMSRATPMTRTSTMAPASGATGMALSTRAGALRSKEIRPRDRRRRDQRRQDLERAGSRAASAAIPYQARALNTPVTATIVNSTPASRRVASSWAMKAAEAESTTKLPTTQPIIRSGGSRFHQPSAVPPWLSASRTPSTMGSAPISGQENGSTVTPKVKVAAGASSSQHTAVRARQDQNARLARGGAGSAGPRGQASRSRAASSSAWAASTTATTTANTCQDWPSANSQRRS